ncbi:MAG: DUF4304 domain-containing protein [Verrucomicrobia bacterium]|nr:DUF4304 domain-containing protein [Verrucomicrobiota bacterium]
MKPAQSVFQKVMGEVEAFLTPLGFKRSGSDFQRMLADGKSCHSIFFQNSQSSTSETSKFTFEVFAVWKRRPAWYNDDIPHQKWYGVTGNRIGGLMPKKEDFWWTVNREEDIRQFGAQICNILSSYALPFLDQFVNEQQLEQIDRKWAFESRWLLSYVQAVTRLNYDLIDKKPDSEIRKRIRRVWFAGRIGFWGVSKPVIEDAIQRLLRVHGRNIS